MQTQLRPKWLYISRFGHDPRFPIHFHYIPVYQWVEDQFWEDERYRLLENFGTSAAAALKLQPVQVGPYGDERAPVRSGLSASDWVVTAGGHLLRAGQKVVPVDRDNRPVLAPVAADGAATAAPKR
mgnify:CR=1 FL=1